MSAKKKETVHTEDWEGVKKRLERQHKDILDLLDTLPDPPEEDDAPPFPYGTDKARPYGWYFN